MPFRPCCAAGLADAASIRTKAGAGWRASLIGRRPGMVAAVAQANKAARIAWALLARGGRFDPQRSPAQTAAA
ncbi:MAG: hypothetical protein B7Z53_04770 [Rhodospirillales bacterium 12-71-4]|nr:MAG: hypothetical protein B7Z53_04770 [Rhodospirillales bacterium 12-71-4]